MVKFGTYLVGSSKIVIDETTSENQLSQIAKDFPALRKFIGYDNNQEESTDNIEVVAEPAKPKSRRKRKS